MNSSTLHTQYAPDTRLSEIRWEEMPSALQGTCEHFIDSWWNALDPDIPIEASGLADMTVAEIQNLHQRHAADRTSKRYRLITFMRIEPEDDEPLTYEQALSEKDQQELMCPENFQLIEEV